MTLKDNNGQSMTNFFNFTMILVAIYVHTTLSGYQSSKRTQVNFHFRSGAFFFWFACFFKKKPGLEVTSALAWGSQMNWIDVETTLQK